MILDKDFANDLTFYHAKYFSYVLARKSPFNDFEGLTAFLLDAQVDIHPHYHSNWLNRNGNDSLFTLKTFVSNGAGKWLKKFFLPAKFIHQAHLSPLDMRTFHKQLLSLDKAIK